MKFKDFIEQHKKGLGETAKLDIYQRFLEKRERNTHTWTKKIAIFTKTSVYGMAAIALSLTVFWLLNNSNSLSIFGNKGFFISKETQSNYRASANSIGRIESFYGSYELKDDQGNTLKTNIINPWDTITLAEGSYMQAAFNGNLAKILGPATIKILPTTTPNSYLVDVINGWKFIEIEQAATDQSNNTGEIKIQKNNVTIEKALESKTFKVQITQNNQWEVTVKNYGDNINITNKSSAKENSTTEEEKKTEVTTQHQVTLNDDELEQTKIIAITNSTTQNQNDQEWKELENIIALLQTTNETVPDHNTSLPWGDQDKKLLSEKQITEIAALLQGNFLRYDIKNLINSMHTNNTDQYNIALANIAKRIINIASITDLTVAEKITRPNIKSNVQTLITKLPEEYHLPPSMTNNLIVLQQRLSVLENKENVPTINPEITAEEVMDQIQKSYYNPFLLEFN